MKNLLGILGGMGPRVSAEFLQTIYEFNLRDKEQDSPACILYSDPTFPDRTEAILSGSDEILIERLVKAFEDLVNLGVSKIVIACVTLHHFLPRIPRHLQDKAISLIDVILEEVLKTQKRHLLLCTKGTHHARIFQNNERWSFAEPYVAIPCELDQKITHDFIYQIKGNDAGIAVMYCADYLGALVEKYQVDAFIVGCTEFHLVAKYLMRSKQGHKPYGIVDPLLTISANLGRFIDV